MGVERAVTRWYLQRDLILGEIVTLEAKLTFAQERNTAQTTQAAVDIQQQLANAQEKLRVLGSCPRPMMG